MGVLWCWPTLAELPLARLTTIFPPGGQSGGAVDVTLAGDDLDAVRQLHFTDPRITASLKKPPTTAPTEPTRFLVSIGRDVPPGLYDVRAVGRFGITNPRVFRVGAEPQTVATLGNTSPDKACVISFGAAMFGNAVANARQYYRVLLRKGQHAWVNVAALSLDSKMESEFVASDPTGREIAHSRDGRPVGFIAPIDGEYAVAIHDVLYRGGAEYFYRLCISETEDREPSTPAAAAYLDDDFSLIPRLTGDRSTHDTAATARVIQPPCEVQTVFRSPRFRDWYRFDAPAGSVYRIEAISQRFGEPTSLVIVVQRADARGALTDVQLPPADLALPTAPEFSPTSRDPAYRLEAKEAGSYRVMVHNVFGSAAAYRLVVRRASPDFRLGVAPASPLPEPADSQAVPVWTTLLRKGGVTPIKVNALRCDGFNGDIHLRVDGLPPGVTADDAVIPAGAATSQILLSAKDDAAGWTGPIRISGSTIIDGRLVGHAARPGIVADSIYNAESKTSTIRSRRTDQFMLAVSDAEHTPFAVAPATTQAVVGSKATISLKLAHHAEFTSPVTLKLAGHPLLGPAPAQTIDTKTDSAAFALDLAPIKLPPGEYTLYARGQGKLKYTGADGKSPAKELTASFYSLPFVLKVTPLPATQPTTQPVKKS